MFIREPSFNKPADRHAAKKPQVPEKVSFLISLVLMTSHGTVSSVSTRPGGHTLCTIYRQRRNNDPTARRDKPLRDVLPTYRMPCPRARETVN